MSNRSVSVLCTNCGQVSRRPSNFIEARRSFVCGGCKEVIPLDERTILQRPDDRRQDPAAVERGQSSDASSSLSE